MVRRKRRELVIGLHFYINPRMRKGGIHQNNDDIKYLFGKVPVGECGQKMASLKVRTSNEYIASAVSCSLNREQE